MLKFLQIDFYLYINKAIIGSFMIRQISMTNYVILLFYIVVSDIEKKLINEAEFLIMIVSIKDSSIKMSTRSCHPARAQGSLIEFMQP